MARRNLLLVTLRSFISLMVIIWEDWKVEKLHVDGALTANRLPTIVQIKAEPNTVATKQFSCINAPKFSLFQLI